MGILGCRSKVQRSDIRGPFNEMGVRVSVEILSFRKSRRKGAGTLNGRSRWLAEKPCATFSYHQGVYGISDIAFALSYLCSIKWTLHKSVVVVKDVGGGTIAGPGW
jgi:hypothetical protein